MQNSRNFDIMGAELELGDKSLVQLIGLKELFKSCVSFTGSKSHDKVEVKLEIEFKS
jgi:hypothetical protein